MRAYIIRRLLMVIPTLLLVSLLVFFIIWLIPGDAIDWIQATAAGRDLEIDRAAMERELGLDAPVIVQYARWVGVVPQADGSFSGALQGNLGASW